MIRYLTWILTILFTLAFAGAVGVLVILYYFGRGLPDYAQLAKYEPPVVSRIYAGDGRLFAEYATQKRVFVPIEAIPRRVIQTFLAAEDKNFYEHSGLDFMGIIRAAIFNFTQRGQNKRPKGASTITQQVAKNLLLSSIATKASYDRKVKEAILSFRIENSLSKDRILELYLNEIFLGAGSYGIAAAALNYFNKSLDELSIAEAAFLAGLPKAPSKYNPKNNYESAKARRDWVVTRMYEERIITREEALAAKAEPIRLQKPDPTHVVKADYFAEEVRRRLISKYGEASLYKGGLTVRTTLDPHIQKIADWALRKGLITYDRRHGWRGPLQHITLKNTEKETWQSALTAILSPPGIGRWQVAVVLKLTDKDVKIGLKSGEEGIIPLSELKWARDYIPPKKKASYNDTTYVPDFALGPIIKHPQDVLAVGDVVLVDHVKDKKNTYSLQQLPVVSGALMVMDPHTGRILAMTGGFSFEASQFNRATQALRQPGSAIKPFVYLTAMERGFSPATIVSDAPIYINMGRGLGTYAPKNVINRHYGPQPLRIGLQKSLNRMTIRLVHEYVGMKPVAKLLEKFGIMDRVPMQIAMAIGAGETTLERLTTAYAMLANGGKKLEATLIDRIQDRHGKTLFTADKRVCSNCHADSWRSQELPTIEDTREQMADPRSTYQITSMLEGAVRDGSARKAQALGKIIAVKTGTTNDERDAWAAGYTPDFVFVTYIGYDHPETLTRGEGGARVAVPVLVDCAEKVLKDVPSKPFPIPAEMKLVRMGNILEAFKKNQSTPRRAASKTPQYSAPSDDYSSPNDYRQYGRSPSYPQNAPHTYRGPQASPYNSHMPPRPQQVAPYNAPQQQRPQYAAPYNAPMPQRPQYAAPYNAPQRQQYPAPYRAPMPPRQTSPYTSHNPGSYGTGTGAVY
jgi:penicillin-binding protein 1A